MFALPFGSRHGLQVGIGTASNSAVSAAAPLSVVLAPVPLQPAHAVTTRESRIPAPHRLAAAITARAEDVSAGNALPEMYAPTFPEVSQENGLHGIPLPHYYEPQELTRRARILGEIDIFLGELRNEPGSGKATLRLWINENGGVDRVETENAAMNEVFASAVLRQFSAARFQPAEREGYPVKSLMRIEVEVLPRSRLNQSAAKGNSPTP